MLSVKMDLGSPAFDEFCLGDAHSSIPKALIRPAAKNPVSFTCGLSHSFSIFIGHSAKKHPLTQLSADQWEMQLWGVTILCCLTIRWLTPGYEMEIRFMPNHRTFLQVLIHPTKALGFYRLWKWAPMSGPVPKSSPPTPWCLQLPPPLLTPLLPDVSLGNSLLHSCFFTGFAKTIHLHWVLFFYFYRIIFSGQNNYTL